MTRINVGRADRAKQEVVAQCVKLLDRLSKSNLPNKLEIEMSAWYEDTMELASTKTSIVIPKPINYRTMGRLTGKIKDHQVSVWNDGDGHFKVTIDDKEYPRLSRKLVEEQLGIPVQKKRKGGSSETSGRAVWRHLTDRYNLLDRTVSYFDEFVSHPFC